MAMRYVNQVKAKAHIGKSPKAQTPVLTDEDEVFLTRVATSAPGTDIQVPQTHRRDAQFALMDGAQNIPLPPSPDVQLAGNGDVAQSNSQSEEKTAKDKKRRPWSWIKGVSKDRKSKESAGAHLSHIADALKSPEKSSEGGEVSEQEEDLTTVLERLNLAAVNNRVFSISDETQDLLRKFNLIFKDLVNGVPTAYNDLESLLTNGDKQLQKTFSHLPGFLQKLIEHLPEKLTESLAPEILAAAAAVKAEQSGINMENAGKAAGAAQKMGLKIPSLKEVVGRPAAIVGLLRSITAFLRARFPALMGMNVLWSLALFLLLITLWYCHKRGREVRLERERLLTEQEVARLGAEYASINASETLTTTAPENSPIEQVEAGIREAQQARQPILAGDDTSESPQLQAEDPPRHEMKEPHAVT